MEKKIKIPTISIIGIVVLLSGISCHATMTNRRPYIVHMDHSLKPAHFDLHTTWYEASLKSVSPLGQILYNYEHAIQGFSVPLTKDEAEQMENQLGVINVLPDVKYELHTTRTPSFLGMVRHADILPTEKKVSQVIIGVLDTGIWPESPSLSDEALKHIPIPNSWNGTCETGKTFKKSSCNNKLIGARFFSKGYEAVFGPIDETQESRSPRDEDGHGTHTSTTAAGAVVRGANLLGYAYGAASGMAVAARIAAYKVCWKGGCFSADILAAIDKAIHDRVNVLSLSIGGDALAYDRDFLAKGTFAAMEKGILVSCSAGNSGPGSSTLTNVAPWLLTVGAGTLDRDFPAYVSLGNREKYSGVSLYKGQQLEADKLFPFVYAGNVSTRADGKFCLDGTLDPKKVKGKIVLCDRGINARVEKGSVVEAAGGLGMVLTNTAVNGEELVADAHLSLAIAVGESVGNKIKKYLFSDHTASATIQFGGTKLGIQPSPMVAAFSSRGPNPINQNILKPDLIAPGVNILAGWTDKVGPTSLPEDHRRVEFNIISGTSMSCPHVSGLAALLKAAHPDWSPAAIRSALMTTAYTTYNTGQPILDTVTGNASTPFDHGSGHVNPISAFNPGLVYDLEAEDYLNFLCALNYNSTQIRILARRNFTCQAKKSYSVNNLNYPSFAVPLKPKTGSATYKRTLTNVGPPGMYNVSITSTSKLVKISVVPATLTFTKEKKKKSYKVTFRARAASVQYKGNVFGTIEWSDGKHIVKSPVAFIWVDKTK